MKRKITAGFAAFLTGAAKKVVAAVKPKPKLTQTQLEDLEYMREVNERAAQKRAERAAVLDELLSGRESWLPSRPGWLKTSRSRWLR